jgi:hypothetical protein
MIAYNLNTIKSDQIYILTQNTIKEKKWSKQKKKKKKKIGDKWGFGGWLYMIVHHHLTYS